MSKNLFVDGFYTVWQKDFCSFTSNFKECGVLERNSTILKELLPISVTARSTAWVYGRSLSGIVGSNPAGVVNVCFECCGLSGRGLCDELITRPEKSYRMWCVVACDLENLKNGETMARVGPQRHRKKKLRFFKMGSMYMFFVVTGRICLNHCASASCFLCLLYRLKLYFTTVAGFIGTRQDWEV